MRFNSYRATRIVALWLDTEQDSRERWLEAARDAIENAKASANGSHALNLAVDALAGDILHYVIQGNPLDGEETVHADLLAHAMFSVDWHSIACDYIHGVLFKPLES